MHRYFGYVNYTLCLKKHTPMINITMSPIQNIFGRERERDIIQFSTDYSEGFKLP